MSEQADIDSELLEYERRQTSALESLRTVAFVWSAIGGLALVLWLIVTINGGR